MEAVTHPRRDLTILAVSLVGVSRLLDGPLLWLVAGLVFGAVALGAARALDIDARTGLPLAPLLLPGLAAAGSVGAVHVLSVDLSLVPALAVVALLVDRSLAIEASLAGDSRRVGSSGDGARGESASDAGWLLPIGLLVAFVAFLGAAVLVPHGIAEPAAVGSGPSPGPLGLDQLAILALVDAAVAAFVGYRLAALVTSDLREGLWSAATYGAAIGIAAATLRAMEVPRLLGPALLTLLLYLWNAYRGSSRATRRSARWIWESALLALLAIAVVAWNVIVRS